MEDAGLISTIESYLAELVRRELIGDGAACAGDAAVQISSTMEVALFRFVQIAVSAILAGGESENLNVKIDIGERDATIHVEALNVSGDRGSIETRLDSDHLARCLRLLKGQLTTEQRQNKGFSVEVVVPIPDEAVLS